MAQRMTISRRELYKLIWSEPTTTVAKTYSISDVGLAKVCDKHDIPRPPRGYWARLQHGQTPEKIPLPKPDHNPEIEFIERPAGMARTDDGTPLVDVGPVEIRVAETLRGCTKLVGRANEELQKAKTDADGIIVAEDGRAVHIRTSKQLVHRALLIFDALLKECLDRGYSVTEGPTVTIQEHSIKLGIYEPVDTKTEPDETTDLSKPYEFGHSRVKTTRVPSGRLVLAITDGRGYWASGARHTWRDTDKRGVEECLNKVLITLVDYYPYQIVSIDFIKSAARRDVFIEQCPELVIVDETHTCARPTGASSAQQQRYHLVSKIAAKSKQHLILLTATPHSGKPEEFQSLLGLLRPEYESLDLPTSTQAQLRELAQHFVQRKRADVEKWMGEDTPFPEREAFEWPYDLSRDYASFFDDILAFARKMVVPDGGSHRQKRVQYWTALALLRGVMSSPDAGVKMLNTRLDKLAATADEEASAIKDDDDNPVRDLDYGFEGDNAPTQLVEQGNWTDHQRRQLRQFADRLQKLGDIQHDQKLYAAAVVLQKWIDLEFKPVVFCRYIETANYLGKHLELVLRKKFPKIDLRVITSELPDDLRKQQIAEMAGDKPRVLIATDCLSEGINLQESFSGVLHYDLPWNPNRLEQREGRVDRFGQKAPQVKACLLYGSDNPIDGIVLDVLLRKVREIKRTTGINVPFPEDSQSIIDTITQSLLLNPDRRIEKKRSANQPTLFDFVELPEATAAKANVTRKIDEAAEREKASRSIFAQNAIKAHEIAEDLQVVDEAIGNPKAVEEFVTTSLESLFGVQVVRDVKDTASGPVVDASNFA
jgi:superfamily II DNA or RNA helicase